MARNRHPSPRNSERGIILILFTLLLVPLVLLISWLFFFSNRAVIKGDLQFAADGASYEGVTLLNSTRVGYNLALPYALQGVRSAVSSFSFNRKDITAIDSAYNALKGQYSTSSGIDRDFLASSYLVLPGGKPEWQFGNLRVRIQRGRWWPDQAVAPASTQWHPDVPNFEPFDRTSGNSWQSENPGIPQFVVANAVLVEMEDTSKGPLFGPFASSDKSTTVRSLAYASRPESTEDLERVAPFAIHACELVDTNGDFNPAWTCQIDRMFTQADRYCPPGSTGADCHVRPGFWWGPLTEQMYCAKRPSGEYYPWTNEAMCHCAQDPFTPAFPGQAPCQSQKGYAAITCDDKPWSRFGRTSNAFGVVGVPESSTVEDLPALGGPITANADSAGFVTALRTLFQSPEAYLYGRLGDRFYVRRAGLDDAVLDDLVFNQILGVYGSPVEDPHAHPLQFLPGGTPQDSANFELGYAWVVGRMSDYHGYPGYLDGPTKSYFTEFRSYLEALEYWNENIVYPPGAIRDVDDTRAGIQIYTEVQPNACKNMDSASGPNNALTPQFKRYGYCNSRRVWYDNRCQASYRNWEVPAGDDLYDPTMNTVGSTLGTALSPPRPAAIPAFPQFYPAGVSFTDSPSARCCWYDDSSSATKVPGTCSGLDCCRDSSNPSSGVSNGLCGGSSNSLSAINPCNSADLTWGGSKWRSSVEDTHPVTGEKIPPATWPPNWLQQPASYPDNWKYRDTNYCTPDIRQYELPFDQNNPSQVTHFDIPFCFHGVHAVTGQQLQGACYYFRRYRPWNCTQTMPHVACPATESGVQLTPDQARVWRIKIPIIAEAGSSASACNIEADNAFANNAYLSKMRNPHTDWRIVGFIESVFFDNDIGKPPPEPPSADKNPPVCGYDQDFDGDGVSEWEPWGFRNNIDRLNPNLTPCNMVRGRTSCKPGLVSTAEISWYNGRNYSPTIVY